MNQILISRRRFVQSAALTAAAAAIQPLRAATAGKQIPISVQLYSVRGDCAKDFDATLATIAQLGFAGVEFAGYYNYKDKPKELRKRLDDLGLKASGTHIGTANFKPDKIQQVIEFHQEIGCKYLIVPMDGDFTKPDKSQALADVFNQAAATLKPHGMGCGYHNHKVEFDKIGDTNHWELFAQRTSKDVILQIDFGWTAAAHQDGPDLVKRHPGRVTVCHLKPTVVDKEPGKKAIFGEDSVDWPPILKALQEFGGTEWLTVEQEVYPDGRTPMECTALSFEALKKAL